MKQINIIGLFDAMADLFKEPRVIPWGITAKEKDELLRSVRATVAKKKHRKMVERSRRKNRG